MLQELIDHFGLIRRVKSRRRHHRLQLELRRVRMLGRLRQLAVHTTPTLHELLLLLLALLLLLNNHSPFQLLSASLVVQTAIRLVTGLVNCINRLLAGHEVERLRERLVFLLVIEDGRGERRPVMYVVHLSSLDADATPASHAKILLATTTVHRSNRLALRGGSCLWP